MRHSNKKRDNVAKSRPGSNTGKAIVGIIYRIEIAGVINFDTVM